MLPTEIMRVKSMPRPSFADAFVPGLIDPTHGEPASVVGPHGKGAVKRYNVYRNNVTVGLINALVATFPAVRRLTGDEFFRAMAQFYVRATPPRSKLLFEYGHDFPAFIENYEYARELPYLADVARIERAWLDAYHAPDLPVLTMQALAEVNPEALADIRLVAHPATRLVSSAFPAVSIFALNRREETPIEPLRSFDPEDALITRPAEDVVVRHLPPGGSAFLSALLTGVAFGEAADIAVAASSEFDLSLNITGMIAAGAFAGIRACAERQM